MTVDDRNRIHIDADTALAHAEAALHILRETLEGQGTISRRDTSCQRDITWLRSASADQIDQALAAGELKDLLGWGPGRRRSAV